MNILLLQGPLGPFFQTLANMLLDEGHHVFKITFNRGDECWPSRAPKARYTGTVKNWPHYLKQFCKQHHIDTVICYGDCRIYHAQAAKLCHQQGIVFWALEEGYLRPDFVTMEMGGANANSPLFATRSLLPQFSPHTEFTHSYIAGKTFRQRAWYASYFHINKYLGKFQYPHYSDHRPWGLIQEAGSWVLGGITKMLNKRKDHKQLQQLAQYDGDIFLLPLQIAEDFQIRCHSNYRDTRSVIKEVVSSFAHHAPDNGILMIKHHPMDRGFINYSDLINTLRQTYRLGDRLVYGFEWPLPQVYPLLKGVITVNSTVGMSALLHNIPVKCLGKALYDIPGLTSAMPLSTFWRAPSSVAPEKFNAVRDALLHLTQLNGCFYKNTEITAKKVIARVNTAQAHSCKRTG